MSTNIYGVFRVGDTVKVGPTRNTEEGAIKGALTEAEKADVKRPEIVLVEAENKAGAVARFEAGEGKTVTAEQLKSASGNVTPIGKKAAASKAKADAKPKKEKAPSRADLPALTDEKIAAVTVPRGKHLFVLSRTGMAYHLDYAHQVRNGVVDYFLLPSPDLESIGGPAWEDGKFAGQVHSVPVLSLHGKSCARREEDVRAAATTKSKSEPKPEAPATTQSA